MKNTAAPEVSPEFESLVPEMSFTRRDFVATMLGTGFALAVQPVIAQQVITTDTQGLTAGEIKVPTKDGSIPAYRAQPETGSKFPVILVVSEIWGVHQYIADVCRRLGKLGYMGIAPELFVRQGDPRKLSNVQAIQAEILSKVTDAQVMADLDACVAWAETNGGDTSRLAVTGFCWGGRIAWLYSAHQPKVKAGIVWYGRIEGEINERTPKHPLDVAAQLKTPVLGLYGGKDQGISLENVEDMKKALAKGASKSELHVYPDAGHAFHADYRPSYRKEAAEDGWKRLLAWLKQHGV